MTIKNVREFLEELFFESIEYGNMAGVEKAMREGIDPHINDDWAICLAAKHGQTEMVEFLLSNHNLDACNRYNTPLREAAENEHREIIKILLKYGADDKALSYEMQWKYADEILGKGTIAKMQSGAMSEFGESSKKTDSSKSYTNKHISFRNFVNKRNRKLK